MISRPNDYLVEWKGNEDGTEKDGLGWTVKVDVALPQHAMKRIVEYSVKRFVDMWRGLPPGDNKEALAKAIELLKVGKLVQTSYGPEIPAFQSTEKTTSTSYFI